MARHVRRRRGRPGMRKPLSRLGLPGRVASFASNGGRSLVQIILGLEVWSRLVRFLLRSRGTSLPVVWRRQRLVALQKIPVHWRSASFGSLVHDRVVHPEQLWTTGLAEGLLDPGLAVWLLVVDFGLPLALRDPVHVVLLVLLQVGLPRGLRDLVLGGLRGLVLLVVLPLATRGEDDLLARPALGSERRGRRRGGRGGGGRRARPCDGREERRRRSQAS